MRSIKEIASDIMDLFLKDFADSNEDNFFGKDFFIRQVCDSYTALMQVEYEKKYAGNRADGVHKTEYATLDEQFLRREKINIKGGKATLEFPIMGFRYDQSASGLQDIKSTKLNLIKIKYDQQWELKHVTSTTEVFYFVEPDNIGTKEILFLNEKCEGEAWAYYIPVPSEELNINLALADDVKAKVLMLVWQAMKDGTIQNETNDSSKPQAIQTELNTEQVK